MSVWSLPESRKEVLGTDEGQHDTHSGQSHSSWVKVIIPIFIPFQPVPGNKRKVRNIHTYTESERKKNANYYNLLVTYQVFVIFQKINNHWASISGIYKVKQFQNLPARPPQNLSKPYWKFSVSDLLLPYPPLPLRMRSSCYEILRGKKILWWLTNDN